MPSIRVLCIIMLSFLVTACGGGGSLEKEGSIGGGDAQTGDSSVTLEVTVFDENSRIFNDSNPVSKGNKGTVTATLLDNGIPSTGKLISFTTNFTGRITPELGTALTDENGKARVTLSSGNSKGAGEVVATYAPINGETLSKVVGFVSSGDDATVENALAQIDIKLLQGCNTDWDKNRNNASLEGSYSNDGCKVVNQFASDDLIDVLVKVTDTSSGDGFAGGITEITTDLGRLLPDSGKALTDDYGFAILKLQPGATSGAGEVSVTAQSTTAQKAFEIATAQLAVSISNGLYNKLNDDNQPIEDEYFPLAAGATTVVTVNILDSDENPFLTPLDVEFSSGCVQAGLSVMDEKATSIGGVASTTYRTQGCNAAQGDTVTATVITGGSPKVVSVNMPVSAALVSSIEFVAATENVIALKGTGGIGRKEVSELTFKLVDEIGNDAGQKRLDFRLSSTNGGITLSNVSDASGYSHASVVTDSSGLARVQVNAGFVPQAVRVQACYIDETLIPQSQNDNVTCWQDVYLECKKPVSERNSYVSCPAGVLTLVEPDQQITSVSDLVSISSGLPDGNSFTASAQTVNVEGLDYVGDISEISLFLADHFNNPVPDGTAVYLTTEGGAVGTLDGEVFNPQLECRTIDGACTAQWRNQNPKPFTEAKWGNKINAFNPKTEARNCDLYFGSAAPCMAGINAATPDKKVPLGGRITVLATAKGQESFIDINGNGRFDTNEYFSGYDLPEAFVDHTENGNYDGLAAIFDPVDATVIKPAQFCQEGTTDDPCSPENTNGGHFEEFFDTDSNEMYTLADGKYNGLVCSQEASTPTPGATFESLCTKDLVDVRESFQIILSGSTVYSRFVVSKEELREQFSAALSGTSANATQLAQDIERCEPIHRQANNKEGSARIINLEQTDMQHYCDIGAIDISSVSTGNQLAELNFELYYSDIHNNPIAAGTAVAINTENGDLSGSSGFEVGNNINTSAASIDLSITREVEPNQKSSGFLTVTFTTPKNNISTARLQIKDSG